MEGPWTIGDVSITQGKRSDLVEAMELLEKGMDPFEVIKTQEKGMHLEKHYARYSQYIKNKEAVEANKRLKLGAELRVWQQELLGWVSGESNDRTIIWIFCKDGNTGKSWMASYLAAELSAFVGTPGKRADLAHAYQYEKVVVFDCARSGHEGAMDVLYGVAEDLKNGRLFSPKYDSTLKVFEPPHVIFFANEPPNGSKWSQDRYAVYEIVNGTLTGSEERSEKVQERGAWN